MYKGLIEINPGHVTWYKLSLSSTSIEILDSKEIKINKILNFSFDDRNLFLFEDIIELAKIDLAKLNCFDVEVIAVSDFPPMLIARLRERNEINKINNDRWQSIVSPLITLNSINLWFERDYAKIAWIKRGTEHVQRIPYIKLSCDDSKVEIVKEISRIFALYDFQTNIKKINVGGLFDSFYDDFVSCVILVLSKMFPYAEISYDLPAFIELYTGLKLKSYS
ncbi:hypothetical protein COV25_00550 [candidate division WWE3 bacterium CG10_big_fil_rev_8_21_14_0_10_35_32]|nr:MAG: hypothetical protein COV25_00550 [candidate division WWE3 bacterium CG10_big_fil_rev_8_21_14_0_10_35_32]